MAESVQKYDFLHRGWLMKMGHRHKALRKRFFVMTEDKIIYSKAIKSTKPQGVILISDITHVDPVPEEETSSNKYLLGAQNVFKIVTKDRVFICAAETSVEMHAWIGAIEKVLQPSKS